MRTWTIMGLEGLCDDWGYCDPYSAADTIRRRQAAGENLTEQHIEKIARMYHCCVKWEEQNDGRTQI